MSHAARVAGQLIIIIIIDQLNGSWVTRIDLLFGLVQERLHDCYEFL